MISQSMERVSMHALRTWIKFSRDAKRHTILNWEKCHFMFREGIVLGHRVSERGIEVDRAKIEVIEQLPPPTNVKGVLGP